MSTHQNRFIKKKPNEVLGLLIFSLPRQVSSVYSSWSCVSLQRQNTEKKYYYKGWEKQLNFKNLFCQKSIFYWFFKVSTCKHPKEGLHEKINLWIFPKVLGGKFSWALGFLPFLTRVNKTWWIFVQHPYTDLHLLFIWGLLHMLSFAKFRPNKIWRFLTLQTKLYFVSFLPLIWEFFKGILADSHILFVFCYSYGSILKQC